MNLKPGDVFCVEGSMPVIAPLIRMAERFWSIDDHADFGHAGIITTELGDTFEMLWTAQRSHLNQYAGQQILIARPTHYYDSDRHISQRIVKIVLQDVTWEDAGRWYPVHRLLLHLIPPLAKYLSAHKFLVCSELTAKFLWKIGARPCIYSGVNPDTLADEFTDWRNFEIIYKGVWKCPR